MPANANNSDTPLLSVRGVSFSYGARKILDKVSFDVRRGQLTALVGPSASGKSTLLKILGAQLRPDEGQVLFDGVDVHKLGRADLYELRKRMGMMFQAQALLTDLTVFENVAFPLREHTDLEESLIRAIVLMKLEAVGLRGAADMLPGQLSGGMNRRIACARAIAMDPALVMYDEPFAGLDPITVGVLQRLIRTLNDGLGLTGIVVTHSVDEMLEIADEVHVLGDKHVLEHGAPAAVRASKSPYVQQFFTGKEEGPVSFHYPAPAPAEDYLKR
jgi:phospholipid/cholesterol/gamma-HCH transport system ATP-binding protein